VKIVKNERDPPLFTGKLLIKFQNILRNTTQVIIRHSVKILFSAISSPITLERQKWKSSKCMFPDSWTFQQSAIILNVDLSIVRGLWAAKCVHPVTEAMSMEWNNQFQYMTAITTTWNWKYIQTRKSWTKSVAKVIKFGKTYEISDWSLKW
jgi:hypothetical protein